MKKLLIVWKSNQDADIYNFVLPYCQNAKQKAWFRDVELLIWGASQEHVMKDDVLQERIRELAKAGIAVSACKMCADKVGATDLLIKLGVNVMYTGAYLSERLQNPDFEVITI